MSTHLLFRDLTALNTERKTRIYQVCSKHDDSILGEVRWHGPWRQYVFIPLDGCIWSHDCLHDLSEFIKELMNARKVKK